MSRPHSAACALGLALAVLGTTGTARAEEAAAAQALFDQGRKAMAARDYAAACPRFEESLRLQEALGTLLNLADCYEHAGRLASAWTTFLAVSAKARTAGQSDRARVAKERASALAPKLSSLVLDVPPESRADGLEVQRDSSVLGPVEWGSAIPVDAGMHEVRASAPGRKPWSQAVAVPEGAQTVRVSVPPLELIPTPSPEPAPAPPSSPPEPSIALPARAPAAPAPTRGSPLKTIGLVIGGAGVAGVGTGVVFGILSLAKHNDAAKVCPPSGPCPTMDGVNLWRSAHDLGDISTVAFAAGGGLLAVGAALWILAPKAREPVATGLVVTPGHVAWQGAF